MKFAALLSCLFVFQVSAFGQQLPRFQVEAKLIKGNTPAQEEKMRHALTIFEKVMNDELFQEDLLDSKFYSGKDEDQNLDTKQVVEQIYKAAEVYNPEPDNKAEIYWITRKRARFLRIIEDWDWGCRVMGFGNRGEKEIYTYTCFFDSKKTELNDIVNHIAHEWTHKLGYEDITDNGSKIKDTVPYAFGNLVEKHAAKKYIQP